MAERTRQTFAESLTFNSSGRGHVYQLHSSDGSSHRLLADLVRRYHHTPVLDVGTAGGYLGQLLAGSGVPVDGIEPDPAHAASASRWYRDIKCGTLEEVRLEGSYGTIVCGDVLEHLVDPQLALKRLASHLSVDGVMLVSLPNVAHLAVRLLLMSGRFPRMDRGPLDRTHLHFFTRATAEQLLSEAGFEVMERHGTVVPLPDIVGRRWRPLATFAYPVQRVLVGALPGLFAYQWVFALRARPAGVFVNEPSASVIHPIR